MAAQGSITDPLLSPLSDSLSSPELQCAIFNALWLRSLSPEEYSRTIARKFQPYFYYYKDQCQSLAAPGITHWHVIRAAECLRIEGDTKDAIRQRLRTLPDRPLDDQSIDVLIPLAVRLCLMISVGDLGSLIVTGQTPPIPWAENECLKDIIDGLSSPQLTITAAIEFPKSFKALNLKRQAGIKVAWTVNLSDHLLVKDENGRPKVYIFHHASFLKHHLRTNSGLLRADIIRETLQTLALLLPQVDDQTRRWYHEKQTRLQLDTAAIECGLLSARERRIDNFHCWRDRLIILKQAFDDTKPMSILGLWRDDRRKEQWYAFWVAMLVLALTLVFGLIQSITGIVQAANSHH